MGSPTVVKRIAAITNMNSGFIISVSLFSRVRPALTRKPDVFSRSMRISMPRLKQSDVWRSASLRVHRVLCEKRMRRHVFLEENAKNSQ